MGAILSAALMLDFLGLGEQARALEKSVEDAVVARQGTADIGGALGTRETGDHIARAIRNTRR
jgi:3-isopropylmalate dehydrogenase